MSDTIQDVANGAAIVTAGYTLAKAGIEVVAYFQNRTQNSQDEEQQATEATEDESIPIEERGPHSTGVDSSS